MLANITWNHESDQNTLAAPVVIVCLAVLGGLGVWMKFTNRLLQPPPPPPHRMPDNSMSEASDEDMPFGFEDLGLDVTESIKPRLKAAPHLFPERSYPGPVMWYGETEPVTLDPVGDGFIVSSFGELLPGRPASEVMAYRTRQGPPLPEDDKEVIGRQNKTVDLLVQMNKMRVKEKMSFGDVLKLYNREALENGKNIDVLDLILGAGTLDDLASCIHKRPYYQNSHTWRGY